MLNIENYDNGFPSLEGLSRSIDGTEYIFGGSVAINRILNLFRNIARTNNEIPWVLYLINVMTLVDNVFSTKLNPSDIEKAFINEINILKQYIEAYTRNSYIARHPPIIILYIPTYDGILKQYKRIPKEGTNTYKFYEFFNRFKTLLPNREERISNNHSFSELWFVPVGHITYPHKDLYNWLNRTNHNHIHMAINGHVGLLTNHTLDLHIANNIKYLYLLERYTGNVLQPRDFGKRIDNAGHIPFNIFTHRALGDKIDLLPIVDKTTRIKIIDMAIKNNWLFKSQNQIAADLCSKEIGLSFNQLNLLKI